MNQHTNNTTSHTNSTTSTPNTTNTSNSYAGQGRDNRDGFRPPIKRFADRFISPEANAEAKFMANADFFDNLKPKMLALAKTIREAVSNRRRIFIRHHADCDGFCAGIGLERAIIPLIESVNDKKQAAWEKYKRMPSVTPFYNLEDVTKDIAQFLSLEQKFGEQMPLVLLVDLGSGPENILPIKQLQIYGCEVAIIDHHPIDPTVDSLVGHHINPLHFKTECEYSAGILCAELSKMINPEVEGEELLAAISCVGDRVEEDRAAPYFAMVSKEGYDKELLLKVAKSIDFTAHNLRGVEGRELMDTLLGGDKHKQLATIDLLSTELAVREKRIIAQAMPIIKIENTSKISYALFPVSDLTLRDMYPRLGNIVGMMSDYIITNKKAQKPLVMLGTTPNSITFRAQDETPFDFPTLLKHLQETMPLAFVEGGGHPHAGTLRCAETKFDEVMKSTIAYLHTL